MAVTFTFTPAARAAFGRIGAQKTRRGVLTLTGAQTAGGDVVPPAIFGLTEVEDVDFLDSVSSAGYVPTFDPATKKISGFENSATPTSNPLVATATDVVTATIRVLAKGF